MINELRDSIRQFRRQTNNLCLRFYLKSKGAKIGTNVFLGNHIQLSIEDGGKFHIGSNVTIGQGTVIKIFETGTLVIADDVQIANNCYIDCAGLLEVGKNAFLVHGVSVHCSGNVRIGADALIASYTSILDSDHQIECCDIPIRLQENTPPAPVIIEEDVWIGNKATVLKGVTIGKGAVIGANAVVTKCVPDYAVAVGIPAKVIRYRCQEADRRGSS